MVKFKDPGSGSGPKKNCDIHGPFGQGFRSFGGKYIHKLKKYLFLKILFSTSIAKED